MPLVFQKSFNPSTTVGVWEITEGESFFLKAGNLIREISHPHKRIQHLAGRFLLQQLHEKLPLHNIKISASNKPYLVNDECHFSISHCGNYAAAVVCEDLPAGLDVEIISEKALRLAPKFMNEAEHRFFNGNKIHDTKVATAIWSIKEAVFKWYGKGKVDFRNDILVETYPNTKANHIILASFTKDEALQLELHLHWMEDYVIVWLCK